MPEPELITSDVACVHLDMGGVAAPVYVSSLLMPDLLLSNREVGAAAEASALSLPSCHLPDRLEQ